LGKSDAVAYGMSTYCTNSYVRIPSGLEAGQVLKDVHSHLGQACEREPKLAQAFRLARVRHQKANEWICLYEVGFKSLKESNTIEVLRAITQKHVDEVVMLSCFGMISFGAYGHFVEGRLVRFVAACEDWRESAGSAEPWESELMPQIGDLCESTIVELGKKLQLPGVANHSQVWDTDIPVRP
jgi:hypothetical protein